MILSDKKILAAIQAGDIVIEPYDRSCLGTNSYDVHLSKYLAVYNDEVLDAITKKSEKLASLKKAGWTDDQISNLVKKAVRFDKGDSPKNFEEISDTVDDYVEDLGVRRKVVVALLRCPSKRGHWREDRGEEPMHTYYAEFDWLDEADIAEVLPENGVPSNVHIEDLDAVRCAFADKTHVPGMDLGRPPPL